MILKKFTESARELKGTVIFAEGDEERTLEAAVRLNKDEVCKVVIVSSAPDKIEKIAKDKKLDISKLTILVPALDLLSDSVLNCFVESRIKKGLTKEDAEKLVLDPLYFSALYVKSDKANGCVAGARSSTSDVLKAAIQGIGTSGDTKLISSFFLMIPPENHPIIKTPIIYADCGVNPNPNTLGLRDISISSIKSFRSLFPGESPKLAFLSFSTKGSAKHKTLDKIIEACNLAKEYFKNDSSVKIDGEVQFDTASVPAVAKKKAPDSPLEGRANIFIFPDLNSGNICYKVTERLGQFTAIGPVVQGLEKPFNDLSRGCSVDDIYHSAVITLLQSRK
ncbi:MAG: phosphotransacetylase [Endomicrobiales bacterium]|nr:phosphotransacetylase [Endomicrobiales bacterium]